MVELGEDRARLLVAVDRQVGQAVRLGERHQRAGQLQHALEQSFRMEQRVVMQVRQAGERAAAGVKQPERRDVAGAELDDVLGGLAVRTVQRVDLGLQHVEQAAQHRLQDGRGGQRHRRRHEVLVELEAAGALATQAQQRHRDEVLARLELAHQAQAAAQRGHARLHGRGEPVGRGLVAHQVARAGLGLVTVGGEVVAGRAHRRQREVEHDVGGTGRDARQRDGRRQFVILRRGAGVAIGKTRPAGRARAAWPVPSASTSTLSRRTPQLYGCIARAISAWRPLVIGVLTLEMLGTEHQPLTPKNLGRANQLTSCFIVLNSSGGALAGCTTAFPL